MAASSRQFPEPRLIPHRPRRRPEADVLERGRSFFGEMDERRSVRMFSSDPVPREAIELAIMTASTAPSGAHQQPWTFVAIGDPGLKHQIRIAVEEEERRSYEGGRMPAEAHGSGRHLFGHERDTVARLSPYAHPSDEDVR
ncbi:MAG: nitroreductase family protein [Chloroflexi bacterium]|nr:nitroreductase family protein [Chloroflexota bacterium]